MATTKIDDAIFSEAMSRAEELEKLYSSRNEAFKRYQKMYLMDWEDKPTVDGLMETISPDPRNAVRGARSLLIATDPVFSIPDDRGINIENTDDIELAAKRIWIQAGRAAGQQIHYAAVESALLFGNVHIAISSTADMLERAKNSKLKGRKAQIERLAALTPYLLNVWNPEEGYPAFDITGLCSYYRKVKVKVYELTSRFGDAAIDFVEGRKMTDEVDLGIWYDYENYSVWADNIALIAEPHELITIPISATVTSGSPLFSKPDEQIQPFLYTVDKSQMWQRQNLSLTTLYTNIYNIAVNPTFVHTGAPGDTDPQPLAMDFATAGGVINLKYGEKLEPMVTKGIIDPSFQQALQITEQKVTESTIYKQTLGQPLTGNPSFSMVSLLSQSGRQPLIETQRMCSEAIADTMEKTLLLYRNSKGGGVKSLGIKPSDVPEFLQMDVKLDVDLPQDKLQMANITGMLTNPQNPITTKEWARENILNIGQSNQMDEDIISENMFQALASQYLAQRMQQMQQQQPQPGQPQPGQMPPEMQQGVAPGAGPVAVGAEGAGMNPGMGGLPPQMAGMIPGMGEGQMPPEMMGGMNG